MLPNPCIPDYWSPQEALAVYEFLDELRDRVWNLYREQIIEELRSQLGEEDETDHRQLELPFDDPIPF